MDSQTYLIISLVTIGIIATLILAINPKKNHRLSALAGLSLSFALTGIVFSGIQIIGLILLAISGVLIVIDVWHKLK